MSTLTVLFHRRRRRAPLARTPYVEPSRQPRFDPAPVVHVRRESTGVDGYGRETVRVSCSCGRFTGPVMTDRAAADRAFYDHFDSTHTPKRGNFR